MKKFFIVVVATISCNLAVSQDIEIGRKTIEYLASDELEGRFPGTKGDSLSQKYIDKFFYTNWIGKFAFGYKQPFTFTTGIKVNDQSRLKIGGLNAELGVDYYPVVFSAEKDLQGKLVYGGATLKDSEVKYNQEWVLILLKQENHSAFREVIMEIIAGRDRGAGGLLFVSEQDLSFSGEFLPFKFSRAVSSMDMPVIQISREFADKMLGSNKLNLRKLKKGSVEKVNKKLDNTTVVGNVDFDFFESKTANMAGYIEGSESNEWIVFGAHYDHLGYGGEGSGSRSPDRNEIHNGADDNASGVGMVLMLADYFKKKQPRTNMAFVLFGAEEEGLIGSKYFVENAPFPIKNVKAMVNFDMVGRMVDSALSISGTTTAKEFKPILETWNNNPLKLSLGGGGYAGSDQASFYSEDIPVLFFNSGLHDDYHTPDDDENQINYSGMELIGDLAVKLADSLDNPSTSITFVKSKMPQKDGRYSQKLKVKLGIMPDVASAEKNGMRVDGVRHGGPADNAGIKKGDVIIAMNGKKVSNIYDYMQRLSEFDKGQKIPVEIIRDGEKLQLSVQF